MSFKQKLEQAARELMIARRAHEDAQAKWDRLCAVLPGLNEEENPSEESTIEAVSPEHAQWLKDHPQGNVER